jgi:WhiB family transcriptional regulator, redox-sensing transcriptional regulator
MTFTDTIERPPTESRIAEPTGYSADELWLLDAACVELDTATFFSDDLDDIAEAKRVCLSCPVRTRCLDAAVERGEQYGVWGGHLFVAGRIVLSKRRRGRPPKTPRPGDVLPEVEVPDIYRRLVTVGPGAR